MASRIHRVIPALLSLPRLQKNVSSSRKSLSRNLPYSTRVNNQFANECMNPKSAFPEVAITKIVQEKEDRMIRVTFSDCSEGSAPYVWLRDNCQCSGCFDHQALARKSLLIDLDINIRPESIDYESKTLKVTWSDSHVSVFNAHWLYERAFIPKCVENYLNFYQIQKVPWSKDVVIDRFDYPKLMTDDELMLEWLITLERKGISLIECCPDDVEAGPTLANKIAFPKDTHYGRRAPVKSRGTVKHLAYKTLKLGLHNELPFYNYLPGVLFLHTVRKHEGDGGGSVLSDGLHGVKLLKETRPEAFKLLSETGIYFWIKGVGVHYLEKKEFHKINYSPVIELDSDGEFQSLRMSTWGRDSHMFLPHDVIYSFYDALTSLNKILYENSIKYKMESGEMLVFDNYRCLHGREECHSVTSRHLETSYMDWDEVKCQRRCLQEKIFNVNIQ